MFINCKGPEQGHIRYGAANTGKVSFLGAFNVIDSGKPAEFLSGVVFGGSKKSDVH